jgi:hypothetical protein
MRWLPVVIVLLIITLAWRTGRDALAYLLWDVWQPEDTTPLVLPAELVVAKLPPAYHWYADRDRGGLYRAVGYDAMGFPDPKAMERLEAPWQKAAPVPIPDTYTRMSGGPIENARFVARCGMNAVPRTTMDIISKETKKLIARVEPYASVPTRQNAAWHPSQDILVAGGQDYVMLLRGPKWQPHKLATAARDMAEWSRLVGEGRDETGYRPHEGVSQLLFNDDGTLLICAMDRGLRVYSWQEVLDAKDKLPTAKFAVDNDLVEVNRFATLRNTYAVEYDPAHKRVLWAGLDRKLRAFDLEAKKDSTWLTLPEKFLIRRMEFLDGGKILCCEINRIGKSTWPIEGLFLLDYKELAEQHHAAK